MREKIILITGGTGSWGEALAKRLVEEEAKEIRIFARNEAVQFNLAHQIKSERIKTIIGDIRDKKSLLEACRGVDVVIHLAALKHVPICESQPLEAIKTNVIGTQNVIDVASVCKVKKVIYMSTDKAADPSSTYGFTKALGEKIVLQANNTSTYTKFICLRSGNLLGSNGSVIPVFRKQLEQEGQLKLTDKRMTRFFVPIEHAIELLLKVIRRGNGGEIFVMKMPAFKIYDIAQIILESYQKGEGNLIEVGARPGEKLEEVLITALERENAYDWDEDFYVIGSKGEKERALSKRRQKVETYSSKTALINREEVKKILFENGFLTPSQGREMV